MCPICMKTLPMMTVHPHNDRRGRASYCSIAVPFFLFVVRRTYAVGGLSLRQSGTLLFNCVRFFRATRGKTAHRRSASTLLPQAKTLCHISSARKGKEHVYA